MTYIKITALVLFFMILFFPMCLEYLYTTYKIGHKKVSNKDYDSMYTTRFIDYVGNIIFKEEINN